MEGLPLILVPGLVAMATALIVTVAAARLAERRERARLLSRIGGLANAVADGRPGTAEIFRQSAAHAGHWWKLVQRTPYLQDSDQLLEQAGLDWSTGKLARLVGLSGLGGGLAGLLLGQTPLVALLGAAAGMLLPMFYVRRRRAKRMAAIEAQLPEAIDLLSRTIRAGHALSNGLRLVAEESPEPIATEFRRVFEEQKYGMRFEETLLGMTRRVNLVDIRVMVVAILVQREVGGNLAEILDNMATLIRTRFGLRRQVRVYTAQGRVSGYVLGALPFGLAAVIYLFNPGYLGILFTDPTGRLMLGGGLMLQLVGYFWMSRILKIDF